MLEKLLKIICPDHVDGKCYYNVGLFGESECGGGCPKRDAAQELIDAGFVQVVRCKDCKHAQRQELKKSGGFEGLICEYDQEHFTAGDHFCSCGERREE